jgi:hypothetical protein
MNGSSGEGGEVLTGGNMSAVVKVGDTVRRTAGPWSPTVHRLLHHLRNAGVRGVPEPLGVDDQVPLTAETNPDTPNVTRAERRRRLDLLIAAYATPVSRAKIVAVAAERVADLADFTASRADPANNELREHVSIYRADQTRLASHNAELA